MPYSIARVTKITVPNVPWKLPSFVYECHRCHQKAHRNGRKGAGRPSNWAVGLILTCRHCKERFKVLDWKPGPRHNTEWTPYLNLRWYDAL